MGENQADWHWVCDVVLELKAVHCLKKESKGISIKFTKQTIFYHYGQPPYLYRDSYGDKSGDRSGI